LGAAAAEVAFLGGISLDFGTVDVVDKSNNGMRLQFNSSRMPNIR